jgi:hypothetical protein
MMNLKKCAEAHFSNQSHDYHIAHRADADAEKRVALPYVEKHNDGAGGKLGQAKGKRRYRYVLEAIDKKHTHNRVRQHAAEPRNKRGSAAFSAENEKRYAAQKVRYGGANENYQNRVENLFIRHFSSPF